MSGRSSTFSGRWVGRGGDSGSDRGKGGLASGPCRCSAVSPGSEGRLKNRACTETEKQSDTGGDTDTDKTLLTRT